MTHASTAQSPFERGFVLLPPGVTFTVPSRTGYEHLTRDLV